MYFTYAIYLPCDCILAMVLMYAICLFVFLFWADFNKKEKDSFDIYPFVCLFCRPIDISEADSESNLHAPSLPPS